MVVLEIIEGRKVEVGDPEHITAAEAAQLLNVSRQWTAKLMKRYLESGGLSGIPCIFIGSKYFSNKKDLTKYYNDVLKPLSE